MRRWVFLMSVLVLAISALVAVGQTVWAGAGNGGDARSRAGEEAHPLMGNGVPTQTPTYAPTVPPTPVPPPPAR